MMMFCRNWFVFLSPTLLKSYVFCFYSFQKIETIRPHLCMYIQHSDEVVSLISGDESVVYSCSPMQWMLHSTACPFYCHSGHYYDYVLL